LALVNETSDLRVVLSATEVVLQKWRAVPGQDVLLESYTKAAQVFAKLRHDISALQQILDRCLAECDPESGKFLSHLARLRWLKEKKRAKPLHRNLQEAKKDLLILLEAHNL
jgi:hypothetical protein